jgi:hypothetical protein
MHDPASGLPHRYRDLVPVGEGGFGVVLRAQDQELDRPVAIKRLRAEVASGESLERFRREARRTAALHHPNVIEVLDFGEDEAGNPYLVYEWVEGRDLQEVVTRDEPVPPANLRAWGAAIAEALAAAHQAGVVHRDVKPANVLLRDDGHVLLADLGIARVAHGDTVRTKDGVILGTPAYMAPELFLGEPATPASDQWAWAATLARLGGAGPAWGSDEVPDILAASRERRGFPVPTGDADLACVLSRSMDWDPRARYPDAEAMAAALGAPADRAAPTVVLGQAAPPPAPVARRASRLGPALVVAALLAGGLAFLTGSPPPEPAPPPPHAAPATPTELAGLREACTALLSDHRDPDGTRNHQGDWLAPVAQQLARDPRVVLRWRRFLDASHAWLRTQPGWQHLSPGGGEAARLELVWGECLEPMIHFLHDLHRIRTDTLEFPRGPSAREFSSAERAAFARLDEESLERYESFQDALGSRGESPGVARLLLDAKTFRTYTRFSLAAEGPPREERRVRVLEDLGGRLADDLPLHDALVLAEATAEMLPTMNPTDSVPADAWYAALERIAETAEREAPQGAPPPVDHLTSRVALASHLANHALRSDRPLLERARPDLDLALATRGVVLLERFPAVHNGARQRLADVYGGLLEAEAPHASEAFRALAVRVRALVPAP